jgi:hypothetical protein
MMAISSGLLRLPPELLSNLFLHLTPEAYISLALTCKQLHDLAIVSKAANLHHLDLLPGIKLGLGRIPSTELFKTVRERAASHLAGASLHADLKYVRFPKVLNVNASCLKASGDYSNGLLASQDSQTCRHITSGGDLLQDPTTSPYSPGFAKILQTVSCPQC